MESDTVTTKQGYPNHLAWHETMELHELVAFQSTHLAGFKRMLPEIHDSSLRTLYAETIQCLEQNLRELLKFYPLAPAIQRSAGPDMTLVEAASLLGFFKTAVRTYAAAITETATPQLREVFQRHLQNAIHFHEKVFYFMYNHGYYPAYNLDKLLEGDVKNANAALMM